MKNKFLTSSIQIITSSISVFFYTFSPIFIFIKDAQRKEIAAVQIAVEQKARSKWNTILLAYCSFSGYLFEGHSSNLVF